MKRIKQIIFAFLILHASFLIAQSIPQGFNYQAVARDANGNAKTNTTIGTRYTIRSGSLTGTVVWQETQAIITNAMGQFNHTIGMGTRIGGTALQFSGINWSSANHYLEVEIQIGAAPYASIGNQQLMSVPYALASSKSDTAKFSLVDEIAIFQEQNASGTGGNTSVAGWNDRILNFTQYNSSTTISRSGSTITLQPGFYLIKAMAPTYRSDQSKLCLTDLSNNIVLNGMSQYFPNSGLGDGFCPLEGVLQVTSATSYKLRHYYFNANSLGNPCSISGVNEILTQIQIQKIK